MNNTLFRLGPYYLSNVKRPLIAALLVYFTTFYVSADELKPFTSDGCSLFPDSDMISSDDWCVCCFEHDVEYWRGGTEVERAAADLRLKVCVLEKTENVVLAEAMYQGVRFGGSPYFYNWYRWGYGWRPLRTYQALSSTESRLADGLLNQYYAKQKDKVCLVPSTNK